MPGAATGEERLPTAEKVVYTTYGPGDRLSQGSTRPISEEKDNALCNHEQDVCRRGTVQ